MQARSAALLALLAVTALPASASAKPSVTLAFPPQGADAGQPIAYSFTAAGVPSNAALVIQRQKGTAKKYKTVATLQPTASGSGSLPALSLGRYKLRIAVKRGSKVLAAKSARLLVYGNLDFSKLFNQTEDSVTFTGHSFAYTRYEGAYYNEVETIYSIEPSDNTCRSVHVDWVPIYNSSGPPKDGAGTLSVVQESEDAATDNSSDQQISALDATLTPGESWGVTVTTTTPSTGLTYYVNGTASCYATSRA